MGLVTNGRALHWKIFFFYIYFFLFLLLLFFSLIVVKVGRAHDIDTIDIGSNLSTSKSKREMPVYTEGKITSIRSKGPREESKPGCLCRWVRAKYLTTKLSLRLHEKIYKCPTNSLSFDEKCINDIFLLCESIMLTFSFSQNFSA